MHHSLPTICRWSEVSKDEDLLQDIFTAVKNKMPNGYTPVNGDWRKKAYNTFNHLQQEAQLRQHQT